MKTELQSKHEFIGPGDLDLLKITDDPRKPSTSSSITNATSATPAACPRRLREMRPLIQEIHRAAHHCPNRSVRAIADRGLAQLGIVRSASHVGSLIRCRGALFIRRGKSISRLFVPLARGVKSPVPPDADSPTQSRTQFGNPWHLLDALMSRFELLDEIDSAVSARRLLRLLGLRPEKFHRAETPAPRRQRSWNCPIATSAFTTAWLSSTISLGKVCIVSTGLDADGSRSETRAGEQLEFWMGNLELRMPQSAETHSWPMPILCASAHSAADASTSNLSRAEFLAAVERAQRYIRAGDIYQVNLSHRLTAPTVDFHPAGNFLKN